jgi:hypothetical protein
MPDNKMDIDGFFRQQYQQLPPGTDADADWAQLNGLLDRKPPRLRKKTTRRIIRYLGGLALVTTVTWYAVRQYRQPSAVRQVKTSRPVAQVATRQPIAPAMPAPTNPTTITAAPVRPSTHASRSPQRVWRRQSDTVLLAPPVQEPRPPQPVPERMVSNASPLNNWLQQLAQPTVTFRINPKRDTLLLCPQGTVIKVPAFAFYNTRRKRTEENTLSLIVKECYQYADMVANQLSTTTPNDVLTTGGMIHLSAVADSGQIQSVLFRPLEVKMPMRQYDPAMQLYLPAKRVPDSSNRLDWQPAGQVQTFINTQRFEPRTTIKVMAMQQRVTKGEKEGTNFFEVQTLAPLSEQQIKALLRQRYPLLSGKIELVISEQEGPSEMLKGSLAKATGQGFVMQDSLVMPFDEAWRQRLLRRQDSLAFVERRRQDSIAWRNRAVRDSLAFINRINFENAYSFNVGNLGWINCDRVMAPQVPRVEFVIQCTGTPPEHGLYSLAFTNQQAIIMGKYRPGEIHFGNLPEGFAAQLICVYQKDNKVMSCVRAVRISQQATTALTFVETSPELFRQQLAAMDPGLAEGR